ncbi:hypothetical protein HYPSUDRAFT_580561 [Hypholoma sublateritium FD-334 SS-4]|uniref:Uncharacterized protein n=1 Tax=Hypholoma sublateritium (strain FD-334 SS-4) TaxID=945553 RepID=A0A0D2NXQ5_HYPSF|nr:hypothetical protein HYPSUDRAFT_580561 [Hypholoma sublateritium FD-334 SS-4]
MANGSCIYLFDYSVVNETSHSLPNSLSTCIWEINLDSLIARDISNCFFNTGSAQFFMTASCRIHSVVIEDTPISDSPPLLTKLVKAHQSYVFPRYTYCRQTCLGYSRTLAIDRYKHVLWIKHYARNIKSKTILINLPPACRAPIMDEESGRVVVPGFTGSQKMTVIDFALVFKKVIHR